MKLTIFDSDMGDCLLLEAATGELMLCDGGMKGSLETHVRAELSALRDQGRELEFIYVSHVDNDHINGVLQLLEDEAEWRVFEFHASEGDSIRAPAFPRPPHIKGILHNAFHDQVKANNLEIRSLLAAAAPSLYASAVGDFIKAADAMQGIAAGIPQALLVSGLISADALDIPLNKPPGSQSAQRLLFAGQEGASFSLGSMKFTLIGPTKKELNSLAKGWNNWIRDSPEEVAKVRAQLKKRIEDFSNGVLATTPYDLRDWNGIPDIKGVTAPNIASLMFLVEENQKRILLTGDAQQDFILEGLEREGFLDEGFIHVDVLKVQHHGSENNLDQNFAQKVSADHYVFCGNGSHGNPEEEVLDLIFASRTSSDPAVHALAPKARDRDFHFWFSTTSAAAPPTLKRRETFAERERHVAELAARADDRLTLHFNEGHSTTLTL
jgi:hypothetical protein